MLAGDLQTGTEFINVRHYIVSNGFIGIVERFVKVQHRNFELAYSVKIRNSNRQVYCIVLFGKFAIVADYNNRANMPIFIFI